MKNDKELHAGLKVEALQNIKKTQRDLAEYKNTASRFAGSKNPSVQELVKECLMFHEYASEVVKQHHNFVSSPKEFISSNKGIDQLTKYTALLHEQSNYLTELVQKINDTESTERLRENAAEFQETKEEKKAMSKWKNKTTNELLDDAMNGEAAALHMLGMCYMYGLSGFPINLEAANRHFAASASLGFAPALEQIRLMYLEKEEDSLNNRLFLQMIYLNLISTFGHTEFTMGYHDLRKELEKKMGIGIVNEIERIATQKTMEIYETKNRIETSKDKEQATTLLLTTLGIVAEDSEFDGDYWYDIFDKEKNTQTINVPANNS